MVVQHNLTAMNSNRMLGITTNSQAKSTEKLSSGYKINRAADDAAGLSISEKMRKQIRGLSQASLNAQDGISAVQTAEGALNEVQDMLQRMNELAVKAANGTMSENDRSYIQNEIDALVTEIDRVSETTKFNETYLLQGDARGEVTADIDLDEVNTTTTTGAAYDTKLTVDVPKGTELTAGTVTLGTVTATASKGKLDFNALSGALKTALDAADAGDANKITLGYTPAVADDPDTDDVDESAAAYWTLNGTDYSETELKEMGLNVSGVTDDIDITKDFSINEKLPTGMTVGKAAVQLENVAIGHEVKLTLKADRNATTNINEITTADYDPTYVPKALEFDLQVGADTTAANKISARIESMNANSLGLVDENGKLAVDGADSTNADAAVNTIAAAIQKVSTQRSALGAIQNRLEHTIANLDNVVENTTAAESQIRDTDMATEMVKYSNNNILAQAGQAMLAQANQSNQGVLSLLG